MQFLKKEECTELGRQDKSDFCTNEAKSSQSQILSCKLGHWIKNGIPKGKLYGQKFGFYLYKINVFKEYI